MINIRNAGPLDCRPLADLLNQIIQQGGTTAHTQTVTSAAIGEWMSRHPSQSAWHVAESDDGTALGFQFIEPHDQLPDDACDISTFVRVGQTGLGIGTRLFDASRNAARALGYRWINATIRADNSGGLAYYQSRGFETYHRRNNVTLSNGLVVDKVSKRYDL